MKFRRETNDGDRGERVARETERGRGGGGEEGPLQKGSSASLDAEAPTTLSEIPTQRDEKSGDRDGIFEEF